MCCGITHTATLLVLQASNLRPYLGDLGAVHEDLRVLGPGRLTILRSMRTIKGVCQRPGQRE